MIMKYIKNFDFILEKFKYGDYVIAKETEIRKATTEEIENYKFNQNIDKYNL